MNILSGFKKEETVEAFFAKISELLIASGTAGSWAVIAVILIIYGWFKYIKPFLDDWIKIRGVVMKNQDAYEALTTAALAVEKSVIYFNEESESRHASLRDMLEHREAEMLAQLSRDMATLFEKIKDLSNDVGKHSDIDIQRMNELMVELTKINLRLEMSNSVGHLRGMK